MFVGFTESVKGFRLWHPIEKKCVNSCDVTFREDEMFMMKEVQMNTNNQPHTTRIEVEQTTKDINNEQKKPNDEENRTEEVEEQGETSYEHENLQNYSLARDRQRRVITPPIRFVELDYVNLALNIAETINDQETNTFEEAISCNNAPKWIEAMNEEMNSMKLNETWTLKSLPKGYKSIACKWVYKYKVY